MSTTNTFLSSKAKIILLFIASLTIVSSGIYYLSQNKAKSNPKFNPAFKSYISSYTGGIISRESPIKISFVSEMVKAQDLNTPVDASLFDFDPEIKGTAMWTDKSTIEFQPENPLPPGKVYDASFELGKITEAPKDLKVFDFKFQVEPQSFEVNIEGLRSYDVHNLKLQKLVGSFVTADIAENSEIEKVLSASQENNPLKITWIHNPDRINHQFQIESIQRKETKGEVLLKWDGESISAEKKGEATYEIPALGDFKIMSVRAVQGEEQYVEIQFSDPLMAGQQLEGLVAVAGVPDLRLVTDENIIKVYPPVRQVGSKAVTIYEGIKNIDGKAFSKTTSVQVNFEEIKPGIRLIGKGVILPSTDGLLFPFEAVSLKAVRVKVTKVFENNVKQFFQVNQLDGDREILRVGKVILKKTISLNNTSSNDYAQWKRYSFDLTNLIQAEPGAIYQVKLSFTQKDAVYTCADSDKTIASATEDEDEDEEIEKENEASNWDYYEDYYYDENYDYNERENPCHSSYYNSNRTVSRNILASDIGIIAKIGNSGNMFFAVTDLKTTKPIAEAKVEVYDFQQQILSTEKTNAEGISSIQLNKQPFLVVVNKDNQVGYLKLDNPSALSITNFDVSGAQVQKGIKGFIYGERGVWRPGDSLYLSFVLENKLKTLPENQPVVFELINPMGLVTRKIVSNKSVNGFYNFSTNTDDDAPTGNWMSSIKVGGATFTQVVKIETIMPNRLKIKLDFGKDKITAEDNRINGKLNVKWLHGATAKNLDADISMLLSKSETKFDHYPEYIFDDPSRSFTSESMEIFKGNLDNEGNATVDAEINTEDNAPGVLTANFKVKVMEEGGGFSVDRFSMPYYPYNTFVGIRLPKGDQARNMLLTDTNHVVDIVVLDPDGNPAANRDIEMQLYKIEWRWWWQKGEEESNTFLNNSYSKSILTENIKTDNGKAKWKFRVNYPEWGRYYVRAFDKKSGHSSGKIIYIDWPGWAGDSKERNQGGAALLNFTADKEKYQVGDKISLSIPGSNEGRALVSIETGSKVVETHWVETKSGKTEYSFTATEEMAPNIYVNVTLIQPHAQTKNDLPIRLYGIIPVKVENPKTFLKPVITMKDELRPEDNITVSIKESKGQPMTYTIAVVDEGLLDLTRFKTPDLWNHFYAREALGVNTWDMYDYVIGAFGDKMEKLLSIGGDGEIKNKDASKAKRFKPVVVFLGPFKLEANSSASHTFKMPQYVGSVRTMVVAGNQDGAFGSAEKTTPVRKPLMMLATLPRVLGPEEYVALPVNLFAMSKDIKNVKVEVQANNLFEIAEEKFKEVSFSEPGDEVVNFFLKVKSATGIGKVRITATSGKEKATDEITLEVRNPNTQITRSFDTVIQPNQQWNTSYEPFGLAGSNKGLIEVSSIPPINLGTRLRYLIMYPYGCLEQTTSSVFPQLFVKDVVQSNDGILARTETNIQAGIQRIKGFQLPEGGLGYWPGADDYDSWTTSYAGHFMLEAEKKGYALPAGFMALWKKHQKKQARNWENNGPNSDLNQAYRLYTLALANEPEIGAMNRLREQKSLSVQAKWRLAAAYHLAGQSDVAKNIVKGIPLTVKNYQEMGNTFGSNLRDKAMILEVLSMLDMKTQGIVLVKELSAALSNQSWMSTQETSYALLAIAKYANTSLNNGKLNFNYSINKEKSINAVTDMKIAQVDMKIKQTNAGTLNIINNTKGPLYARMILSGIPGTGLEQAAENNLKVTVKYLSKDGKDINTSRLEQGTDFIAEVTVINPGLRGDYKQMALKQVFPSGWEIHNARLDAMEDGKKNDLPTYQDFRDDRVYTFFDLKSNQKKTFSVALNAAYIGKYYLPSIYTEAMYDGSVNATIPGKWVEVIKEGAEGLSLHK